MTTGTYIGFSTVGINQPRVYQNTGSQGGTGNITVGSSVQRKYTITDAELVIRDLLNAFSIKQGDLPGNPAYGSTLQSFVFEPSSADIRQAVIDEVTRVAGGDPRILLNSVVPYFQEHGILIEVEMAISPFNNAIQTGFFLNRSNGQVTQV